MDGKSLDILSDKLNKLKELIPEAFTEDKIDWEKLKTTLGEDLNLSEERYHLNWAGKSEVFRVLQQRTAATLIPAKEESINFDKTDNLFIEGENLEVLKVLQKSYFGKIKMIYIDPPYNTGNDSFIYPDKFSETKAEYLKRIGDKDEEGYLLKEGMFRKNSKDAGHYHSNWLTMMYPRLYLARNLMRDDGVIFVSIDDNEVHNLRMIMNEIFGEENIIGKIIWKNATDNNPTQIATEHEYLIAYGKNKQCIESEWKSKASDVKQKITEVGYNLIKKHKNLAELQVVYEKWFKENKRHLWPLNRYKYIDFDGIYIGSQSVHNPGKEGYRYDVIHPKTGKPCKQPLMGYRFPEDTMKKLLAEDKILFGEDENKIIEIKIYAKDFEDKLSSFIELDGRLGSYDIKSLFTESTRLFNNPKPVRFLSHFFSYVLKKDGIVLDFFSGSGTTAQAVMELNKEDGGNRKFVLVQLPEKTKDDSEAYKAGYKTIADICKERIRRVIKKLETEDEQTKDKSQTELELNENIGSHSEPDSSGEESKNKIGFKVFKLSNSNFKIWRSDIVETEEDLNKMVDIFDSQVKDGSKEENMLYELMLKSGYALTDKVEKKKGYYSISNGEFVIVLDKIKQKQIDEILSIKPKNCIMLDKLFAGNDQLKTNTALQMKDAQIEFTTV